VDQFIKSLRHRSAAVQARIEEEQARPAPDPLRMSALQRLKLTFRDQIAFIERLNRHGEAAPVHDDSRRGYRAL
jgi:hypothetical protein